MSKIPTPVLAAMLPFCVSAAPAPSLKDSLQDTLIAGASVSDDYLTPSPGKRLALKYTSKERIKVVAGNGRPGKTTVKLIEDELVGKTAVIGLDLFFWDSFLPDPAESLKAMDRFFRATGARKLDVVVGDIPVFAPGIQKSAAALNARIERACRENERCHRIPLHDLLVKAVTDGHVTKNGKKITLDQLLPDGLHLGAPASELLADEIERVLSARRPSPPKKI